MEHHIKNILGSLDTNHDILFRNSSNRPPRLSKFLGTSETYTTTAYCRILPTLDHHV